MNLFAKYGIDSIVYIDFETTGLNPKEAHPTEVAFHKFGISKLNGKSYTHDYNEMIQLPEGVEVSEFITELTGLTTEKVNSEGKPKSQVNKALHAHIHPTKTLVVAQSANFDLGYLKHHFDIEPKYFICTKTIEFFTNPAESTSLNDTHKRYAPDKTFEQTHRAMDDVNMLIDIFTGQTVQHGNEGIIFFVNKIAVMPERPLVYEPQNATILDYSQKYTKAEKADKLSKAESLLSEAHDIMDDVHLYDSDLYREIGEYFE